MEQVDIGIMLPGAQKFNDENVNMTWKSHIQTHEEVVVGFVKLIEPRKIYIECICAVIGRALGLPIPKPILVQISHESLPDEIPRGEVALGFASQDAEYPSFRRYFNKDSQEAINKLINFSKSVDIAAFDEWIGNWDRNIGNILYDGGGNYSFIDHENAISKELSAGTPAVRNQILETMSGLLSEFEKYKMNRDIQTSITPQYSDIELALISDKAYASLYLSDEDIISVINFLGQRLHTINDLIASRWNFKQQELSI